MAAGGGLRALFAQAGAQVVPGDADHCSTGDFLAAVSASGAGEVVILPNDKDLVPVAEAAAQQARGAGVRVAVIPTRTQVQGLAALAVHEPGRGFDDDVVAMTTAAGQTRHGAVTLATREAITSAGPCGPGDVLGVLHGDFALVGKDVVEVAVTVALRLLDGGGELLTLVTGDGASPDLPARVCSAVRSAHPQIDTVVYDGGQQRYPLLIAVE
jgi:dihydroxyacetone kinase-like predicted kinase